MSLAKSWRANAAVLPLAPVDRVQAFVREQLPDAERLDDLLPMSPAPPVGDPLARGAFLPPQVWGAVYPTLFVQDDRQQRPVDAKLTVVFDEPELPELVQEEVHPGPGRSDHLGQGFVVVHHQNTSLHGTPFTHAGNGGHRCVRFKTIGVGGAPAPTKRPRAIG